MSTRDIVERAISQVLERSSNTGRRVVLHRRHIDNLRHFASHNCCHVRAGFPLAEEISIAIYFRLISTHTAGEGVLDSHDANLGRHQRLITADVHLVRVSVVNDEVPRRHSNQPDPGNDLPYEFGRRTTSRRTRWIDLDAD